MLSGMPGRVAFLLANPGEKPLDKLEFCGILSVDTPLGVGLCRER